MSSDGVFISCFYCFIVVLLIIIILICVSSTLCDVIPIGSDNKSLLIVSNIVIVAIVYWIVYKAIVIVSNIVNIIIIIISYSYKYMFLEVTMNIFYLFALHIHSSLNAVLQCITYGSSLFPTFLTFQAPTRVTHVQHSRQMLIIYRQRGQFIAIQSLSKKAKTWTSMSTVTDIARRNCWGPLVWNRWTNWPLSCAVASWFLTFDSKQAEEFHQHQVYDLVLFWRL